VGEKLWGLAGKHQVMVVTHLAQIAGFADTHYRVAKSVSSKRTTTQVELLEQEGRIHEMAEMLGGATGSAMQNAQELFEAAQQVKQGGALA